jgi:hypothetical protein
MRKLFGKILCLIGIHKDKFESIIVAKGDNWETSNNRFVCERCGKASEWTGSTTFSTKILIDLNEKTKP